jgi:ferredoxin
MVVKWHKGLPEDMRDSSLLQRSPAGKSKPIIRAKRFFLVQIFRVFDRRVLLKYKIEINREDCIACGTCYSLDPEHFAGDHEGKSSVVGGSTNGNSTGAFNDEKMMQAKTAADSCPVSIITVMST